MAPIIAKQLNASTSHDTAAVCQSSCELLPVDALLAAVPACPCPLLVTGVALHAALPVQHTPCLGGDSQGKCPCIAGLCGEGSDQCMLNSVCGPGEGGGVVACLLRIRCRPRALPCRICSALRSSLPAGCRYGLHPGPQHAERPSGRKLGLIYRTDLQPCSRWLHGPHGQLSSHERQ
jgi:hypothetical protein